MHRFEKEFSSFRDNAGAVFYENGNIFRTINFSYQEDYKLFISSGLKDLLLNQGLLISFNELNDKNDLDGADVYKVISPSKVNTLTYPYEWSFLQLKLAALTTLKIQKHALAHNMVLKDASAYNIQFFEGRPVLIDITSFEKYRDGSPWRAYSQFCRHFLCPLLLMKYKCPDMNALLKHYIDGVPVELTSHLLPLKTRFNLSVLSHVHWHASSLKHYQSKQRDVRNLKISKSKLILIMNNLIHLIDRLNLTASNTEWADYYNVTNYSSTAEKHKKEIIEDFIKDIELKKVVDFGANNGTYSRIFSNKNIETISLDKDPMAVEQNFQKLIIDKEKYIIPLKADLCNPSPAIGWHNKERKSLLSRLHCDLGLALALVHHLFITNNLNFEYIAALFNELCHMLIIEFVPIEDSQVQKLILNRTEKFDDYNIQNFEKSFLQYFKLIKKVAIEDSQRGLYFFEKK